MLKHPIEMKKGIIESYNNFKYYVRILSQCNKKRKGNKWYKDYKERDRIIIIRRNYDQSKHLRKLQNCWN